MVPLLLAPHALFRLQEDRIMSATTRLKFLQLQPLMDSLLFPSVLTLLRTLIPVTLRPACLMSTPVLLPTPTNAIHSQDNLLLLADSHLQVILQLEAL